MEPMDESGTRYGTTYKRAFEEMFPHTYCMYQKSIYPGEKPGPARHDEAKVSDVLHRHN